MRNRTISTLVAALAAASLLAACGGDSRGDETTAPAEPAASTGATASAEPVPATTEGPALSGTIAADGSSTVGPLTTAAAEAFGAANAGVQVTVGISGTGGGFEKFCAGETDLQNASRAIKDEEKAACAEKGIAYHEFLVANDGIAVVVNKENTWATCLTVDQLKAIWGPDSKAGTWQDADPAFPDESLKLFGPGTDSGTFDFFTKEVNGEEGASRSDYSPSEDDNITVQGVSGEKGGLGYFGLSYYEQNQDKLSAVQVDGGAGCVAPSRETVQDGSYAPLARPLYVYAKAESFTRPEVQAFMAYMIDNATALADTALFVPPTDAQATEAKAKLAAALAG